MQPKMKDECVAVLVLLASVFDAADLLKITQGSATKLLNETFFVLCKDGGGRPVTWRGPKGTLGLKTRPSVQTASYGTSIIFNQTTIEDSGTYTCTAGKEKKEFHLTIEAPLTFMDTSVNQTGVEGNDITLRCEVRGGKITWAVEGGEITGFPYMNGKTTKDDKFTIMGDGLLIKNVHRTDSKTYVCKAVQQSTGMIVDRKIKLTVKHKPTFPHPVYAKQEQAWGYVNGTVNLTCIVVADPPATFEWFKNSDRREKTGRVFSVSSDVSVFQLHVDKSTFGEYKCVAKNEYGRLEKHFSLEEGAKPRPPKFLEIRGRNANLLDLGIHGPDPSPDDQPGMETKGFNVQYRVLEEDWQSQEFNITEDNSYPLQDLRHDTQYEVRAATRNAAGLSDYTNTSTFTTLTSHANIVHATLPVSFSLAINYVATLFITCNLAYSFW